MLTKERNYCSLLSHVDYSYARYTIASINTILALVAVFGNVTIIAAIFKSRTLKSQLASYFIVSLAVADFLVGAAVQPLFSLMLFDWSTRTCFIEPYKLYLGYFSCSASTWSAMGICLDRWLKICKPFSYERLVTKSRIIMSLFIIWIFGGTIGYLSVRSSHQIDIKKRVFSFLTLLWLSTALAVAIFCSLKIYFVGRRHIRNITETSMAREKKALQERRLAFSLIFVLLAFATCWIPFAILSICVGFLYSNENWTTFFLLRLVLITLGYANSSMNIFIYSWKNSQMRNAIRRLLFKPNHEEEMSNHAAYLSNASTPNLSQFRREILTERRSES